MKRLMIIGLWPDDAVNYCTEKCDCRRYAFDRILYHRGGRAARERICIPVVDRSGAVTTYLDLPVTLLEAGVVYLRLDDGSDIFLSNTQMALIANEVERQRAECAVSRRNSGKGVVTVYEVLLELDDLLETLTYWLSFAAVALSVIVVAAYVWHKAAEQKATRAEPRKRKDGMT